MSRVNSLLGQTFNRLTVLRQAESSPQGRARWVCQCDCGNITGPVLGYELTSGGTKSCGCLKSEVTTARNTTHGLSSHPRIGCMLVLNNDVSTLRVLSGRDTVGEVLSLNSNLSRSFGKLLDRPINQG